MVCKQNIVVEAGFILCHGIKRVHDFKLPAHIGFIMLDTFLPNKTHGGHFLILKALYPETILLPLDHIGHKQCPLYACIAVF